MAGGSAFKKPRSLSRSPMSLNGKAPLQSLAQRAPSAIQTFNQYDQNAATVDLIDQIDALTRRSQSANPMVPGSPMAPPIYQPTQQQQSMIARAQAGASNNAQYGNFGPTPGMQYNQGLPQTQAGMANRIANQNPMYSGMRKQFDAGSPLGQRASQYGADQARADAGQGVFLQPGGYGSNQQFSPFDQAAGRAFMQNRLAGTTRSAMLNPRGPSNFAMTQADGSIAGTNRLGALRSAVAANPRDPELQGALQAEELRQTGLRAEKAARHQQFLDDNGGMSANQLRRQREVGKKGQARYNRAVMQGMNPMSPQAQALFPDQTKAFTEQRNANRPGGVAKNPMSEVPDRSLTGQGKSAATMADLVKNDPAISSLGLPPTAGIPELHTALDARMQEDPNLSFADDELKSFQKFAKEADNVSTDQNNQFDFGLSVTSRVTGDLWKELAALPDNPRARQSWLDKYRNRYSEAEKRSADLNADYPPINPFTHAFDSPINPKPVPDPTRRPLGGFMTPGRAF
jgi:hypothetical protein